MPFRYLPILLGGKGKSQVGWDTGDLLSQGKKLRYGHRTPRLVYPSPPHGGPISEQGSGIVVVVSSSSSSSSSCRVVSSRRSACGACTKLPQARVHLCQPTIAAEMTYRNVLGSAVPEGTPFPKGSPKSLVGGMPGWNLSSSARRYGPYCWPPGLCDSLDRSVRRDFRPGRSSASRGSGFSQSPMTKPSSVVHRGAPSRLRCV